MFFGGFSIKEKIYSSKKKEKKLYGAYKSWGGLLFASTFMEKELFKNVSNYYVWNIQLKANIKRRRKKNTHSLYPTHAPCILNQFSCAYRTGAFSLTQSLAKSINIRHNIPLSALYFPLHFYFLCFFSWCCWYARCLFIPFRYLLSSETKWCQISVRIY